MARVIRRSIRRVITRKPLWNGNRESWRRWFDADHPIRWAWSTHAGRRVELGEETARPEYQHLDVVRLQHPREAGQMVARAGPASTPQSS
jgi:hypothetical protein